MVCFIWLPTLSANLMGILQQNLESINKNSDGQENHFYKAQLFTLT